jgi:hypothetical protein
MPAIPKEKKWKNKYYLLPGLTASKKSFKSY